jgi:hypothetical protein
VHCFCELLFPKKILWTFSNLLARGRARNSRLKLFKLTVSVFASVKWRDRKYVCVYKRFLRCYWISPTWTNKNNHTKPSICLVATERCEPKMQCYVRHFLMYINNDINIGCALVLKTGHYFLCIIFAAKRWCRSNLHKWMCVCVFFFISYARFLY